MFNSEIMKYYLGRGKYAIISRNSKVQQHKLDCFIMQLRDLRETALGNMTQIFIYIWLVWMFLLPPPRSAAEIG